MMSSSKKKKTSWLIRSPQYSGSPAPRDQKLCTVAVLWKCSHIRLQMLTVAQTKKKHDRQSMYKVKWGAFVLPLLQWGKQKLSTRYSECVCRLGNPAWNACAILSPVAWPAVLHFFHDLQGEGGGEKLLNIKWVYWFSLRLSGKFLILRTKEGDMIKKVYWSSCKVPVMHVRF